MALYLMSAAKRPRLMPSISVQPVPLSALDAFVADQEKPISRPEAIRVS